MSWEQIPNLLRILQPIAPHGHREWNFNDEIDLRNALDNDRLSPAEGRWSLAYDRQEAVGYSLTEPELNIGRILVGVGTASEDESLLPALLSNGIERATALAGSISAELHVAVRDHEPPQVTVALASNGFDPVRDVWKMIAGVEDLVYEPKSIETTGDFVLTCVDLSSDAEISALTELHNACFVGSWGFSPNTVDEISGRTVADAPGTGGAPILTLRDAFSGEMTAYIWVSLHKGDGRIEMVGVHPSARGKGLGRVIFDAGARRLLDLGAEALVLDVDSENPPAIRIYESIGLKTRGVVTYHGLEV